MKKIICIACFMFLSFNFASFANGVENLLLQDKLAYSASSLKYEINRKNSKIRNNEYKISKIRYSKNISENEKQRQISRLKSENRRLKNDINRLKSSYRRAIS